MAHETLQTSSRSKTVPLHGRAEDNLKFIREAMEGASSFTSISGVGLVGVGVIALAFSFIQWSVEGTNETLIWLTAMLLAFAFSTYMTSLKAHHQNTSIWSASGKRLLFAFCPAMFVGGVITLYFLSSPASVPLPAFWLSLYGAAIMTAGAHSIALLRIIGAIFILLGAVTFFTSVPGTLMMGIGFGGVHIISGLIIWKYHGG